MRFGLDHPLSRREAAWLGALLAAGPAGAAAAGPGARLPDSEWQAFRRRYVSPEGRVVDTGNGGVSHSESQSYGLLLAQHMEDRDAFRLIWGWTRQNLRRRGDALMAWRWDPHGSRPVLDLNNATDGDLIAAWALARAADAWGDPGLRREATLIAQDVLRACTAEWAGRLVLLPGAQGFRFPDRVMLNLSYYSWGALRGLSRLVHSPAWARLEADGLELLRRAAFGRFRLPPDWLDLHADGAVAPSATKPARFSWDALRIPLHLAWVRHHGPSLEEADTFWHAEFRHRPPAWIDLRTHEVPPYAGHAGVRAVVRAARQALGRPPAAVEGVAAATDYYGASLVLLGRLALLEEPEAAALVPPPSPAQPATPAEGWRRLFPLQWPPAAAPAAPAPPPAPSPPAAAPPAPVPGAVRGVAPSPRVAPPQWRPHGP